MEESPTSEMLLRHGRFVQQLARALLSDAQAAEDIAQDVWVQWWRRGGTLEQPRAWLRRAVRSVAANRRRAAERRARHEGLAAGEERASSPGDEAERAELLHRVVDAVFALEEPYRATILGRYFRGLSAAQLARQQGEALATVRSRERRALKKLRERLDRTHGGRAAWAAGLLRFAPDPVMRLGLMPLSAWAALGMVLVVGLLGWHTIEDATERGAPAAEPSTPTPHVASGAEALAPRATEREVLTPERAAVEDPERARNASSVLHGTTFDTSGRPLGGVRLRFGRNEAELEAVSDVDGRFQVAGLPVLRSVSAEREGYRFLYATDAETGPEEDWKPMRVVLAPVGELLVRVYDTHGVALEGFEVQVSPRPEECRDALGGEEVLPGPSIEGETDARGLATLPGVWSGIGLELELAFWTEGLSTSEVQVDRQLDGRLVLNGADGAPIVLRERSTLLTAVWGAAREVRGVVLDESGAPVEGASIEATDVGFGKHELGHFLIDREPTDAQGGFAVRFRPPCLRGPVRLVARTPGEVHEVFDERGVLAFDHRLPARSAERLVTADELAAEATFELRLTSSGLGAISGNLLDPRGEPAPSNVHTLFVLSAGAAEPRGCALVRVHTSGGAFLVSGLAAGLYDLGFASRDPALHALGGPFFTRFPAIASGSEGLRLSLSDSAPVRVRFRAPQLRRVTLARFFPEQPSAWPRPIAPAVLRLCEPAFWPCTDGTGTTREFHRPEGSWIVVEDVERRVAELELSLGEPGWYQLGVASLAPHASVASELLYFEAGEHTVLAEPPPATAVVRGRVVADGTREFYGLVLADERGRPFSLAGPATSSAPPEVRALPVSGEFLLRGLAPGRYRLRVGRVEELAAGRRARELELEVVAGENPPLEIRL